jgi:hypothetical protein
MEAIVRILEAEKLAPVRYIPSEMRHGHEMPSSCQSIDRLRIIRYFRNQ